MNKKLFIIPLLILLFSFIASATDLTTDIVSYYKFDETSGTTLVDAVGNNNGTNNGATIGQTGIIDESYSFDGSNDYVQISTMPQQTNDFTLSLWVKRSVNGHSIFQNTFDTNGGQGTGWGIIDGGSGFRFIYWTSSSANTVLEDTSSYYSDGNWHNFIISKSSTNGVKMYVDGVEKVSSLNTDNVYYDSTSQSAYMGVNKNDASFDSWFEGNIDEVGIWNRDLNSTEIEELYNSGAPTSEQQYPFEASGERIQLNESYNPTFNPSYLTNDDDLIGICDISNATLSTPFYQWKVNGVNVTNGTNTLINTYFSATDNVTLECQYLSNSYYSTSNITVNEWIINSTYLSYTEHEINNTPYVNYSFTTNKENDGYNINNITLLKDGSYYNSYDYAVSCYQESANVSNQTGIDGDCGLNYSGSYSYTTGSTAYIYINYTKPNTTISNAILKYKINSIENVSIDKSCLDYDDILQLRVEFIQAGPPNDINNIQCYNGSWNTIKSVLKGSYSRLGPKNEIPYSFWDGNFNTFITVDLSGTFENNGVTSFSRIFYEEAIIWKISKSSLNLTETIPLTESGNYSVIFNVTGNSETITNESYWFIFDNVNPIISSNFTNNTRLNYNSGDYQFTFTDPNLYRFNVSIDGLEIDSLSDINVTEYLYNLTINPNNYSAGIHDLTVTVADGHTANKIEEYNVKKGGWFDDSYLEFKTDNNRIEINKKDKKFNDKFDYKKEEDRYKFNYKIEGKKEKTNIKYVDKVKYLYDTFIVKTDDPLEIVSRPNTKYNKWIISGDNWIDFLGEGINNDLVEIKKIDDYKAEVTVYYDPELTELQFQSIGDLNIITNNYNFYTTTVDVTYINPIVTESPQTVTIVVNTTDSIYSFSDITGTLEYNGETVTLSKTLNGDIFTFTSESFSATSTLVDTVVDVNITLNYSDTGVANINSNQTVNALFLEVISGNNTCSAGYTEALNIFGWDEIVTDTPVFFDGNIAFDLRSNGAIYRSIGFELRESAGVSVPTNNTNYTKEANTTNITINYNDIIASNTAQQMILYVNATENPYTYNDVNASVLYNGSSVTLVKSLVDNIFTFTSNSFLSETVINETDYDINFTINYSDSETELINLTQTVKPNTAALGSNYTICLYPETANITTDIKFEYVAEDYSSRKYILDSYELNNNTQELNIYLLEDLLTSDIIVKIYDKTTGVPIEGALVRMLRYYPQDAGNSSAVYKTVQIEQTDINGDCLMKAVLGDVWYKFIIESPAGVVIYNSGIERILETTKNIPVLLTGETLLEMNDIVNIQGSVSFNDATETFTYTWNNPKGTDVTGTLKVFQNTGYSKILVYNVSATSSSATLAYVVTGNTSKTKYQAEGWITT